MFLIVAFAFAVLCFVVVVVVALFSYIYTVALTSFFCLFADVDDVPT